MKSDFTFTDSLGFDCKAEFEGLYKSGKRTEKGFHFYKLSGSVWIYQGCMRFPVKFTKKQIISEALENL